MMFFYGRSKEEYVICTTKLERTDPKFKIQNAKSNLVMSWLINLRTTDIGKNFLLFVAKRFWEATRDTYSTNGNTMELFEIKSILHELKQGKMSMFNIIFLLGISSSWTCLRLHNWSIVDDTTIYIKIVERKHVLQVPIGN